MLVNTKVPDFVLNILERNRVFRRIEIDLAGVEEAPSFVRRSLPTRLCAQPVT